ncbi:hypothetical protein SRO_0938 [Streptomyces rochei]|nr:hypothetical protein SRO_0938 [Streptomyces rochei]
MRRVGGEQRVRLRLSRQRPGRVRQRERTDEARPDRQPRQWRDLTVLASLLAVLLTVPGSVWAVLVAQDQLNQSEEAAVKETRAQASRVSAWTSRDPHGKWLIHLMNRSPDPISDVALTFEPLVIDDPQVVAWNVQLMSVPPCSDMTISQDQLKYQDGARSGDFPPAFSVPAMSPLKGEGWRSWDRRWKYISLGVASFTDRNGLRWIRREGRLSQLEGGIPALSGTQGAVIGQPAYRAIEECGDDTGG